MAIILGLLFAIICKEFLFNTHVFGNLDFLPRRCAFKVSTMCLQTIDDVAPNYRRCGSNPPPLEAPLAGFGGSSRWAWRCLVEQLAVASQRLGGCSLSAKVQHCHYGSRILHFGHGASALFLIGDPPVQTLGVRQGAALLPAWCCGVWSNPTIHRLPRLSRKGQ